MATQVTTEDVVRGEKRTFKIQYPDGETFEAGAETWNYSLKVTQTKNGDPLFSVTFGAAQYVSEYWLVDISTTNSALLSPGKVTYCKVWRTDVGFETVKGSMNVTVG